MELEWHGPHVGMEVEEAGLATAEPLRDVLGVAKRRAQRHNADVVADLAADVAHARADDLQHRLQVVTSVVRVHTQHVLVNGCYHDVLLRRVDGCSLTAQSHNTIQCSSNAVTVRLCGSPVKSQNAIQTLGL